MSIVVVGAGHAAHQAALALREFGCQVPITLIGEEPYLPYQRPPLSKAFLTEPIQVENLMFGTAAGYAGAGIDLQLGQRVVSIDRAGKVVSTSVGVSIRYSRLILATGARNRVLRASAGTEGTVSVRTIDDALLLRSQLEVASRVAVVGAGLLGLEFACVARKLGCEVTVVEAGETIMQRVLRPELSAFVRQRHGNSGIMFKTGAFVEKFLAVGGRLVAVKCSDGEEIEADVAVVAIGVVPNDELARAAGLEASDGILVSGMFQTNDESIHAIGDCARVESGAGTSYRVESVQSATDQARMLARYLADGNPGCADIFPTFWSKQGDLTIHIVGHTGESDHSIEISASDASRCRLCFRGGALLGAECVNSFRYFRNVSRFLQSGQSASADSFPTPEIARALVESW